MSISFSTGQRLFFFALLAATTLFFIWMVREYIFPIFWAIVFALLLYPAYRRLKHELKNATLAAALVMLFALLIVVVSIVWLGAQIAQEAYALYLTLAGNGGFASFALPPALLQ